MINLKELIDKALGQCIKNNETTNIPTDYVSFSEKVMKFPDIQKAIAHGSIFCRINRIEDGFGQFVCYKLTTCIERGDSGDEDGFGVEPDTWASSFVGDDGKILCRFCLEDEDEFVKAKLNIQKELDDRIPGDYSFHAGKIKGYMGQRGNCMDLVLPAYIGNFRVSGIAPYAFSNLDFIRSIEIPDSIKWIDHCAFRDCSGLERIRLPSTLNEIRTSVFSGCTNLRTIVIPESVKKISSFAFSGCSALIEVYIPRNVSNLEPGAFYCCSNIRLFTVDKDNEHYISDDGIILSRDRKTMVFYPAAKTDLSYVIPSSITQIENDAFTECGSLERVVIPEGVKRIGALFIKCRRLQRVDIPASVDIAPRTFADCNENLKIYIHSNKENKANYPWGLREDQIIWCGKK